MVKKSATGGAPSLDILAAKLRIVEAELFLEEKEIKLDNGRSFTAEPNLNVKVEVVANLVDPGVDEGVKFYDRFKLKKDDDSEWAFLKYSKLGNLIVVRYGEEWFERTRTPSSTRATSRVSSSSPRSSRRPTPRATRSRDLLSTGKASVRPAEPTKRRSRRRSPRPKPKRRRTSTTSRSSHWQTERARDPGPSPQPLERKYTP
jgi:hypothetical protein